MKTQITFTHNTAIEELHRIIGYARKAHALKCFIVENEEYERAKFLVSFFFYHNLFSEQDFDRFWDEIASEQYNGNEVTF